MNEFTFAYPTKVSYNNELPSLYIRQKIALLFDKSKGDFCYFV